VADTAGANRLQRAVGRGGEADVIWMPARPGWSWMIVSDGVYKAMRLDELAELMAMPSAASACDALRRKVEERGPDDNYTAVLVRALGGPDGGAPRVQTDDRTEPMMHSEPNRPRRRGWSAGTHRAPACRARARPRGVRAWSAGQGAAASAERAEFERLRTHRRFASRGDAADQRALRARRAGGDDDTANRNRAPAMNEYTPADRSSADPGSALDTLLRDAVPEIKLALGELIDRENARSLPGKYARLLPESLLVVTLREDAAEAIAPVAVPLERELTDSCTRHGVALRPLDIGSNCAAPPTRTQRCTPFPRTPGMRWTSRSRCDTGMRSAPGR
jgi:hypothetical protein